jgi:hypothetical protein
MRSGIILVDPEGCLMPPCGIKATGKRQATYLNSGATANILGKISVLGSKTSLSFFYIFGAFLLLDLTSYSLLMILMVCTYSIFWG